VTEAGQGARQVPVEELIGQEPPRQHPWRHRLGNALAWRDWKLPVKLAAVTLVPIVLAIALGVSVLTSTSDSSASYRRIDALIRMSAASGSVLDAVQRERTETAAQLTKGVGTTPALRQARAAVDAKVPRLRDAIGTAVELDPGVRGAATEAQRMLQRLDGLRSDVQRGRLDVVPSIEEYTAITKALLTLDGAATARVSDPEIGGTPQALRELLAAKEEISLQHAFVAFGAARGSLAPSELSEVRTSEVRIEDRLDNFFAVATPAQRSLLEASVSESSADDRARMARSVLGELGVSSDEAIGRLSEREWQNASGRVFDQLGGVVDRIAADAQRKSGELADQARTSVLIIAGILGVALLIAIAAVFVITRHLLRSLKTLRNSAMTVAEKRLPEAVAAIQQGKGKDRPVEPVPVLTRDEVGEVARAFDAVHSQALKLAGEQADMHSAYSGVFVNLSRRSQSLVQRQLQLIERLERDEEDADRLAMLFQLDHLATRMRRNNENLMMLSGAESGRRSGRPVSTADVLRAAVSEIEQYQRVVVQTPPTTKVVGHAASDLMRLIAELLDNATSFSPPETQVTVSSSVGANGSMVIDIVDKGIGMKDAELAEANARMAEASSLTMVTSRRMGLFVVGRLAAKHRIGVTLHGGQDMQGVRATVVVPEDLVLGTGGGPLTSELPVITDDGPVTQELPVTSSPNGTAKAASNGAVTAKDVVNGSARAEKGDEESSELPAGSELFKPGTSPLSDWWNATAAAEEPKKADSEDKGTTEAAKTEDTPIYDEMLSVWFRTGQGKPSDAESDVEARHDELSSDQAWEFAADENLQAVKEVASKPEPSTLTKAGLPKRQRGEHLLPGSATPAQAQPEKPSRAAIGAAERQLDPAKVRSRLSGFQRGVQRGRHHARRAAEQSPHPQAGKVDGAGIAGATPASPIGTERAAADAAKSTSTPGAPKQPVGADKQPAAKDAAAKQDTSANGVAGQAASDGGAEAQPVTGNGGTEQAKSGNGVGEQAKPGEPLSQQDWEFSTDAAWREATAVATPKPSSFTEAGLPRRRRGEQLLPGSAGAPNKPPTAKTPKPERDPAAVRGRLNSFQQGLRRGRAGAARAGRNGDEPVSATAAKPASATKHDKTENMEGE